MGEDGAAPAHSRPDVRILYANCCSGDARLQNAAYQQVGEYLLRIAMSRVRDRPHLFGVAEESTQQALLTIWQKLDDNRGPDRPEWFLTWAASIVIHKMLDEFRRLGRRKLEPIHGHSDDEESWMVQLPDRGAIAPEAHSMNRELVGALLGGIQEHARLTEDAKTVLIHGFLMDRDDDELAELLGKARATVRVLRFRGLNTLRNDDKFMALVATYSREESQAVQA